MKEKIRIIKIFRRCNQPSIAAMFTKAFSYAMDRAHEDICFEKKENMSSPLKRCFVIKEGVSTYLSDINKERRGCAIWI